MSEDEYDLDNICKDIQECFEEISEYEKPSLKTLADIVEQVIDLCNRMTIWIRMIHESTKILDRRIMGLDGIRELTEAFKEVNTEDKIENHYI